MLDARPVKVEVELRAVLMIMTPHALIRRCYGECRPHLRRFHHVRVRRTVTALAANAPHGRRACRDGHESAGLTIPGRVTLLARWVHVKSLAAQRLERVC